MFAPHIRSSTLSMWHKVSNNVIKEAMASNITPNAKVENSAKYHYSVNKR